MSEKIEIRLDESDLVDYENMTLILGARCVDGVVLAADRKFSGSDTIGGVHYTYNNSKITAELDGISTGFSGDVGTFQLFSIALRNHVNNTRQEQLRNYLSDPLMRLRIPLTGVNFDEIMLKISDIQLEFYKKYQN
jgi:20S proteasome alpha/beta subunit